MAVGNGIGRIVTGSLSDTLGRRNTIFGCFVVQACLMIILSMVAKDSVLANVNVLVILAALLGANYGANLAVFPSITQELLRSEELRRQLRADIHGLGASADSFLPLLAGKLHDAYGSFTYAYYAAAGILALAAAVTYFVKSPPHCPAARSS